MPSFDIVSEFDMHEVSNAVDQANREIGTRYDFKGSNASFELNESEVVMTGDSDFQLQQMRDVLIGKLVKRKIDAKALEFESPAKSGMQVKQQVVLKQGIDQPNSKKIIKMIKDKKMKVQAAIQGEQVRVTGKKRDDLQQVMAMLRESDLDLPLQYNNFRD